MSWTMQSPVIFNPINGTRYFEILLCINTHLKIWRVTVCSYRFSYSCNTLFIQHCNKNAEFNPRTLICVNNINDCYTLFLCFFLFRTGSLTACHAVLLPLCSPSDGGAFQLYFFCKETNIEVICIFSFSFWCSVMIDLSVSRKQTPQVVLP